MKRNIFLMAMIIVAMGFSTKSAIAQRKIDVNLGVAYSHTLSENRFGKTLQLQTLYRITDNVKVGVGARLERIEKPGFNTLPIYAVSEIGVPFVNRAFVFADAGYSIGGEHFVPGLVGDAGVGYFLPLRSESNSGFQFKVYYNYKRFEGKDIYYKSRSSVAIGIGYTF